MLEAICSRFGDTRTGGSWVVGEGRGKSGGGPTKLKFWPWRGTANCTSVHFIGVVVVSLGAQRLQPERDPLERWSAGALQANSGVQYSNAQSLGTRYLPPCIGSPSGASTANGKSLKA